MANKLTPPPPTGTVLDRWLALLYQNLTAAGQMLWASISKAGSNLTDLETRNHVDLQNKQGGTTNEYYHLTAAQHTNNALKTDKLSAFAATTSAELAGVISDETGSGALVFGTSPTVSGPTISSGNLAFGATGQYITGDFSNATDINRLRFKSNVVNGLTIVPFVPNGTSTIAGFGAYSNDTANASTFYCYVDGTSALFNVNKIGTGSYLPFDMYVGGQLRQTVSTAGHITPGADNAQNFGSGALRWKEIFAGNAVINTSDGRAKTPVRVLSPDELNVAKQLSSEIGIYQWLSAVEEKGDGARLHCGMTVQRAVEIFVANGLDPFRYGLVCYDEWAEKTTTEEVEANDPDAVINGTKQVQQTETQTRHWQAIEIIDGVATLVAKSETFDAPVFDLLPVFDEAGEPVMRGEEQVMHQVPVMIDAPRYVKITHTPAGNRYSFRGNELLLLIAAGFNARLSALESA